MCFYSSKTLGLGATILILVLLTTYAVFAKHVIHSHGPAMASGPSDELAQKLLPGESERNKPATGAFQIAIDNFNFSPATLTVAAGATVTWTNRDDVPHTVTSTAKPRIFDSGVLDTDQQYSHVFSTPGTYNYFCAVHPHMTAQIVVR